MRVAWAELVDVFATFVQCIHALLAIVDVDLGELFKTRYPSSIRCTIYDSERSRVSEFRSSGKTKTFKPFKPFTSTIVVKDAQLHGAHAQ